MSKEIGSRLSCPECGSTESSVTDTRGRHSGDYIWRRRECDNGHRYSTREVVVNASRAQMRSGNRAHMKERAAAVADRLMEMAP